MVVKSQAERAKEVGTLFSQTTEYALRAMTCLALFSEGPSTTAEIARVSKVPAGYLSKVLQQLTRADLVTAVRGLRGGYRLKRDSSEITILQVLNAVDPLQRIHTCPLGLPEHGTRLCLLHRRLDESIARVEEVLGSTVLADVLSDRVEDVPLCPRSCGLG